MNYLFVISGLAIGLLSSAHASEENIQNEIEALKRELQGERVITKTLKLRKPRASYDGRAEEFDQSVQFRLKFDPGADLQDPRAIRCFAEQVRMTSQQLESSQTLDHLRAPIAFSIQEPQTNVEYEILIGTKPGKGEVRAGLQRTFVFVEQTAPCAKRSLNPALANLERSVRSVQRDQLIASDRSKRQTEREEQHASEANRKLLIALREANKILTNDAVPDASRSESLLKSTPTSPSSSSSVAESSAGTGAH